MLNQFRPRAFRRSLLAWYSANQRTLPWRASADPYRVWLSEIMLQQTRVAAALPFYERLLGRFPTVADLAAATETEVLTYWAGLGYYSRARNLHAAAKQITARGSFPATFDEILALPGVGEYTAAAIASIAFRLPHAVLDGNVVRVLARLSGETGDIRSARVRMRLRGLAARLLDRSAPGDFNQALMELGATVCLPGVPDCARCPVAIQCAARAAGCERELPIISPKPQSSISRITLLIIRNGERLLLSQRPDDAGRLAGFWELPDAGRLPHAQILQEIGVFRHTIVSTKYFCRVATGKIDGVNPPGEFVWQPVDELHAIPLSTMTRKALARLANA